MMKTGEYQFILYNNDVTVMTLMILAYPIAGALAFGDLSWEENNTHLEVFLHNRMNIKKISG